MNIAPNSTISALDITGLPSLLSPGAPALFPAIAPPALPNGGSLPDPSQSPEVGSFAAVLAMFGLTQNLPQPLPEISSAVAVKSSVAVKSLAVVKSLVEVKESPVTLAVPAAKGPLVAIQILTEQVAAIQPPCDCIEPAITGIEPAITTASEQIPNSTGDISRPFVPLELPQPTASMSPQVDVVPPTAPTQPPSEVIRSPSGPAIVPTPKPSENDAPLSQFHDQPIDSLPETPSTRPARAERSLSFSSLDMTAEPATALAPDRKPIRFSEPLPAAFEEKPARHRRINNSTTAIAEPPPPSPPLVEPPTTFDSHELSEQVGNVLQSHRAELAGGKPLEIQLRLDPPELGLVRVHLRLTDDAVSVRFIAGDEAVTRMLQSQLPDLRQSLAERGLAFVQCDVAGHSGQGSQFSRQQDSHASPFKVWNIGKPSSPHFVAQSASARLSTARAAQLDILA